MGRNDKEHTYLFGKLLCDRSETVCEILDCLIAPLTLTILVGSDDVEIERQSDIGATRHLIERDCELMRFHPIHDHRESGIYLEDRKEAAWNV